MVPEFIIVTMIIGAVIVSTGLTARNMDNDLRIGIVIVGGIMFGSCLGIIIGDYVFFPNLYH